MPTLIRVPVMQAGRRTRTEIPTHGRRLGATTRGRVELVATMTIGIRVVPTGAEQQPT